MFNILNPSPYYISCFMPKGKIPPNAFIEAPPHPGLAIYKKLYARLNSLDVYRRNVGNGCLTSADDSMVLQDHAFAIADFYYAKNIPMHVPYVSPSPSFLAHTGNRWGKIVNIILAMVNDYNNCVITPIALRHFMVSIIAHGYPLPIYFDPVHDTSLLDLNIPEVVPLKFNVHGASVLFAYQLSVAITAADWTNMTITIRSMVFDIMAARERKDILGTAAQPVSAQASQTLTVPEADFRQTGSPDDMACTLFNELYNPRLTTGMSLRDQVMACLLDPMVAGHLKLVLLKYIWPTIPAMMPYALFFNIRHPFKNSTPTGIYWDADIDFTVPDSMPPVVPPVPGKPMSTFMFGTFWLAVFYLHNLCSSYDYLVGKHSPDGYRSWFERYVKCWEFPLIEPATCNSLCRACLIKAPLMTMYHGLYYGDLNRPIALVARADEKLAAYKQTVKVPKTFVAPVYVAKYLLSFAYNKAGDYEKLVAAEGVHFGYACVKQHLPEWALIAREMLPRHLISFVSMLVQHLQSELDKLTIHPASNSDKNGTAYVIMSDAAARICTVLNDFDICTPFEAEHHYRKATTVQRPTTIHIPKLRHGHTYRAASIYPNMYPTISAHIGFSDLGKDPAPSILPLIGFINCIYANALKLAHVTHFPPQCFARLPIVAESPPHHNPPRLPRFMPVKVELHNRAQVIARLTDDDHPCLRRATIINLLDNLCKATAAQYTTLGVLIETIQVLFDTNPVFKQELLNDALFAHYWDTFNVD